MRQQEATEATSSLKPHWPFAVYSLCEEYCTHFKVVHSLPFYIKVHRMLHQLNAQYQVVQISQEHLLFMQVLLQNSGRRQCACYWPTSCEVSVAITLVGSPFISRKSEKGFVFLVKPTRCTNFSNLFWNEILHASDSSSFHHQEFFTVHIAMVYIIQVCWQLVSRITMELQFHLDPARKLSA
jgi:hypothetical protein